MPLDYSHLLNPKPSEAITRGGSMVTDALDAVLQRRQQQQMQQRQLAQQRAQALMVNERETERNHEQAESNRLAREELTDYRANRREDADLDRDVRLAQAEGQVMVAGAGIAKETGGLQVADEARARIADVRQRLAEARHRRPIGGPSSAPQAGPAQQAAPAPQEPPRTWVDPWAVAPGAPSGWQPRQPQAVEPQPPPGPEPGLDGFSQDPNVNRQRAADLMDPIGAGMRWAQEPPAKPQDVQPPPQPAMDPAAASVDLAQQRAAPAAQVPAAKPSVFAGMTPGAKVAGMEAEFRRRFGDPNKLGKHGREAYALAMAGAAQSGGSALAQTAVDDIAHGIDLDSQEARATNTLEASKGKGDASESMKKLRLASDDFKSFVHSIGYPKAVDAAAQFQAMRDVGAKARAGDGAGAAAIFKGLFTKYAQGQVGVLNEHDIKIFWDAMGNPETKTEDYIERTLSGKNGTQKMKLALAAVKTLSDNVQGRLSDIHERASHLLRPYDTDEFKHWGNDQSMAYFGAPVRPLATPGAAGAPPASPGAAPSPGAPAGTAPAAAPKATIAPELRKRFQSAPLE